jgi:SAM-dependent methyltransferase
MNKTKNTLKSFSDKWSKNSTIALNETTKEGSDIFNWILNRNGFKNAVEFKKFLSTKKRILDAGCGNGRVTALINKYSDSGKTEIIGIDLVKSAINTAKKNLGNKDNVKFIRKNLLSSLKDLGKFDFIYCQEVLHHTNNPEKAFKNLCSLLNKGGEIAIYVYKKKAPIREFVDDFIRDKISGLNYNEAAKYCEQITKLGKVLSKTKLKIKIPKVELLQIEEGEYEIQRFIYYFFMKCFWNENLSFKDNSAINYDWYHPQICFRYHENEVINWFKKLKLKIVSKNIDFYGITIRGVK